MGICRLILTVNLMSERRSTSALVLTLLMVLMAWAPFTGSAMASAEDEAPAQYAGELGEIVGDLDDFHPEEGSAYLFIHEEEPVVSATGFMRQAWIDAGRPGVDEMTYSPTTSGRSARACTPHTVGDTLSSNTADGTKSVYVAKTTNT